MKETVGKSSFSMRLALLLVAMVVAVVCGSSVPLRRREHRVIPHDQLTLVQRRSLLASGTSIEMGGGLLVLGTYIAPLQVGSPPVEIEMLVRTLVLV